MSEKLSINPQDMTIGDLEDFEDVVGMSMDKAFKPVPLLDENGERVFEKDAKGVLRPQTTVELSTKALKALIWIVKRQDNPDFTLEDARKIKVSELELQGDDSPEDPTAPDA